MIIRKSTYHVILAGILSALACNVQAHDLVQDDQSDAPTFEDIDTNADGVIAASEARRKDLWIAENFSVFDVDRDGYISNDEFDQAVG